MSAALHLEASVLRVGRPTGISRGSRGAAIAHRRCGEPRTTTTALRPTTSEAVKVKRSHVLRGALMAAAPLTTLLTTRVGGAHAVVDNANKPFVETASGLKVLDAKLGEGATPKAGDTVVVHWSGYTSGYQGKRVENTSVRDDPFVFTLGDGKVIPAFEEAVLGMRQGGLRRVEIPGAHPELSYPRKRSERFSDKLNTKYRLGPQPSELGGQRALDFVLDNPTLQDFNRDLVYDIRLLNVRAKK